MTVFKIIIYTVFLVVAIAVNSTAAITSKDISADTYLDLNAHLFTLLDQVHEARLNTIVVMTTQRNHYSSIPLRQYQLIITRSARGWLVTQNDTSEFTMDHYIHNAQQSEWQINSNNIFERCVSTKDNIDKPVVVLLNFSFHCDRLQFNSHNGKMLAQVEYPKDYDVTGIYVSYNNLNYSSYFSFHDNNTYKSYSRYQDDIHLLNYTNNLRTDHFARNDGEEVPIIIPSAQAFNGQYVFIPFSRLERIQSFRDGEEVPIIIPSLKK